MIDTTRYAGHTPAPWVQSDYNRIDGFFRPVEACGCCDSPWVASASRQYDASDEKEIIANRALIEDAPLLLAEVERLREQVRIAESYLDAMANPANKINSQVEFSTYALAAMKAAGGE